MSGGCHRCGKPHALRAVLRVGSVARVRRLFAWSALIAVTHAQPLVEGANALGFAALGPAGAGFRVPGVDVVVGVGAGILHEALQEEGGGDGAGEGLGGDVVDVGDRG